MDMKLVDSPLSSCESRAGISLGVNFAIHVSMFRHCIHPIFVAAVMAISSNVSAADIYKCTINGSITYQGEPCPTAEPPIKHPTVEQLNAERQKKLREVGGSAASAPASVPAATAGGGAPRSAKPGVAPGWPTLPEVARTRPAGAPVQLPVASFRCDGRIYCSQMTSCAEAEYFLANCPGVKMDGDHDGIPCEDQWCERGDAAQQPLRRRGN
jgi:hypothetical protein